MLLKERIRSLREQILSFKRSFHFGKGRIACSSSFPLLRVLFSLLATPLLEQTTVTHHCQKKLLLKISVYSVTCLAIVASLTADPGVASSIPVRSHTFEEIYHEIISTVILFPSAELFKNGCCQLQAKVCARSTCTG